MTLNVSEINTDKKKTYFYYLYMYSQVKNAC